MGIAVEAESLVRLAQATMQVAKENDDQAVNLEEKELKDMIAENQALERELRRLIEYREKGTDKRLIGAVSAVSFAGGFAYRVLKS